MSNPILSTTLIHDSCSPIVFACWRSMNTDISEAYLAVTLIFRSIDVNHINEVPKRVAYSMV